VRVALSLTTIQFSLDPVCDPVDRSCSGPSFRLPAVGGSRAALARAGRASECSGRSLDRCASASERSSMPVQLQLVQHECRFYFIGRHNRAVIFSVLAPTLGDAIEQFRSHGHSDSDALFIIKTETQIFLA